MVRIVVLVKAAPRRSARPVFASDRTLDRAVVAGGLSEIDAHAVEQALGVAETAPGSEIICLTVGPEPARDALANALALGADRGVHVLDEGLHGSDAPATSHVLAEAIRTIGFDLVVCGAASQDAAMGVVPAMLAERLRVPSLLRADELQVANGRARIRRERAGMTEELEAPLPAIVSVTERAARTVIYPSLAGLRSIATKPVETMTLADLGIERGVVGLGGSWTRLEGIERRPARAADFLEARGLIPWCPARRQPNGAGTNGQGATVSGQPQTPDVLVLADRAGESVTGSSLGLLAIARRFGRPCAVLFGPGDDRAIEPLAAHGAARIHLVDPPGEGDPVSTMAEALATIARRTTPALILLTSTDEGKEVAARLAIRVESGLITDALDVTAGEGGAPRVTKADFGGAHIVTATVTRGTPIIAITPNVAVPAPAPVCPEILPATIEPDPAAGEAPVAAAKHPVAAAKHPLAAAKHPVAAGFATVTARSNVPARRPDLAEAAVIVAGGRGVRSKANWVLVERLADALGGAVAASKPPVASGWCAPDRKVGLTGRAVSPELYVAVGISGAIHHRAGMRASRTVVAINNDPDAAIFQVADFGIVGDLRSVIPRLIDEVDRRRGPG